MAKKNFKDTFLNIENEENQEEEPLVDIKGVEQETKKEEFEIVQSKEQITINKNPDGNLAIINTTEIQSQETLNDTIQRRICEIEKEIRKSKQKSFGTGKKKLGFDDMYGGKTISMNRTLKPLFEEICETSSLTRAEVIEKILINGIKNTNFNPPDDDLED